MQCEQGICTGFFARGDIAWRGVKIIPSNSSVWKCQETETGPGALHY